MRSKVEDKWSCQLCTFINNAAATRCEMCLAEPPNSTNSDHPPVPPRGIPKAHQVIPPCKIKSADYKAISLHSDKKGDFKVAVAIDIGRDGTAIGYTIIDGHTEREHEIYIEQDWCRDADVKSGTHILLSADGKFIRFGDDAVHQLSHSS